MCFYIKTNSKPLIAEKDIPCYKIMTVNVDRTLTSSIYDREGTGFIPGNIYPALKWVGKSHNKLKPLSKFRVIRNTPDNYPYHIDEAFHSFSTLKKAKDNHTNEARQIVECVIPKGTSYYYSEGFEEYASLQIKFIKARRFKINIR